MTLRPGSGQAASITGLPAGQVFDPIFFSIDSGHARSYCGAVGDSLDLYEQAGIVPPLAAAALALGSLLNQVGLPPGSLHVNESLEFLAAIPIGAHLECRARLARRSQRSGMIISTIESDLWREGGMVMRMGTTLFSPVTSS